MNTDIEKLVKTTEYYYNKLEEVQSIRIPANVRVHHYIIVVISSIFETHFNTYFIIPLVLITLAHFMVIKSEYEDRVITRCVSEELDILKINPETIVTNKDRDVIFNDISASVSDTGFIYTRISLIIKSLILGFLVHYATIGLLIR